MAGVALRDYVAGDDEQRLNVGREIRRRRKTIGMDTQKQLAAQAKVGVEAIHRLENGKKVELDTLAKVWATLMDSPLSMPHTVAMVRGLVELAAGGTLPAPITPEQQEAQEVATLWLKIQDLDVRLKVRGWIESYLQLQAASTGASPLPGAGRAPETAATTDKRRAQ